MNSKQKQDAILKEAQALCNANNTFSTLELKNSLRKKYPNEVWNQLDVSMQMMDFADEGKFTFTDNGTFRTYSAFPSMQAQNSIKNTSKNSITKQLIDAAMQPNQPASVKQPQVKPQMDVKRIGRKKALEIIQNTNGKFFSVRFEKKNGEDRLMGVQYIKGTKPDPLGYVLLKDLKARKTKSVNLQTLSEIKTNNTLYKVR